MANRAPRFAIQVVATGIVKDRSFKRLTSLNDLVKLEGKIRMEKFLLLTLAGIFKEVNQGSGIFYTGD